MGAESAWVEKFDVVVGGEVGHGAFGVAGRIKIGNREEGCDNTEAGGGEDAEQRILGGGESLGLEAKSVCELGLGATKGNTGGFFSASGRGFFARNTGAVGEVDFSGGALAASGNGMRN